MVFPDAGVVAVPMLHVHVLDQVQPGQQVHGAIHAGQSDPTVNLPGAPVHLRDL
jgi:hypothetical protein